MSLTRFFLLLVLLAAGLKPEAQQHFFRRFDSRQSLPSSEVNDVIQDEQGFLWFSTDHGIVRYDGYQFRTFDVNDGLPENSVFTLRKDPQNRIWFVTLSGLLGYIDQGYIFSYPFNDSIKDYFARKNNIYYTIFEEIDFGADGSLWLSLRNYGILRIDHQGHITVINQELTNPIVTLLKGPTGKLMVSSPLKMPIEEIVLKLSEDKADTINVKGITPKHPRYLSFNALMSDRGDVYYCHDNVIFYIREGKLVKYKDVFYNIIELRFDPKQNLMLSTTSGTMLLSPVLELIETFLPGEPIGASLQDHEGGLWFTSMNAGIYYIPEPKNKVIAAPSMMRQDKIISLCYDDRNRLWFATFNNFGYYEKQKPVVFNLSKTGDTTISKIVYDAPRKKLWIGTSRGLFYYEPEKMIAPKSYNKGGFNFNDGIKDMFLDLEGNLWLGLYSGFTGISKHDELINGSENPRLKRVEALARDADGTLWLGCNTGLYRFDGQRVDKGGNHPLFNVRITSLLWQNGLLWAGTRENGLLLIAGDSIKQLNVDAGLLSSSVKFLEMVDTMLVVGSNKGISVLSIPGILQNRPFLIQNLQAGYGMLSNEVTAMTQGKNNTILAANAGFISFLTIDPDRINRIRMPLHIVGVEAGDFSSQILQTRQMRFVLPFSQNRLDIKYFAISYLIQGRNTYRHRLLGLETDWVVNQQTTASYPYLPPGEYVFQVEVLNPNGQWSATNTQLSITILRPFWLKWWFIAAMMVLVSGLLFFISSLVYKYLQHQKNLVNDLRRYQQEALSLQMNPHFLFNALNTVQRYILENDRLASSRYLTRFAGFMRAMLENAQKPDTTLAEEFELLRQYLELEAARSQPKFHYEFRVDEVIDTEKTLIPVFLLQPLVENAILHGIKTLEQQGKIIISCVSHGDNLIIQVEDNGIGRKAAAALNDAHKSSYGLSILKKRIDLINKSRQTFIRMEIEDLYQQTGEAAGTRVILWFPGMAKLKNHE